MQIQIWINLEIWIWIRDQWLRLDALAEVCSLWARSSYIFYILTLVITIIIFLILIWPFVWTIQMSCTRKRLASSERFNGSWLVAELSHSRLSLYDSWLACSSHTDKSEKTQHPNPQFYAGCPSCHNPLNLPWLGTGHSMLDSTLRVLNKSDHGCRKE